MMCSKRFALPLLAFILGVLLSGIYFFNQNRPQVQTGERFVTQVIQSNPELDGKLMITRTFVFNHTFIGYVLALKSLPSQPVGIVYTDASGTYFINPATTFNIQHETLEQYGFTHYLESGLARQALQKASSTRYIMQGHENAPHKLWIVIDPNCIFCHKTFAALQPLIAEGDVQVRWILVGFLKPSSLGKAAAILSAQDPAQALQTNEANFNDAQEEGAITPLKNPSPEVQAILKTNFNFAASLVSVGTPAFIFKSPGPQGIARLQEGYPGSDAAVQALVNTASDVWQ